jgi:hypothetical protein
MAYDLMLLADPGPERGRVLRTLGGALDVRPDPQLETRFWLTTDHGRAQINIGTKDPVESVHVELEAASLPLMETVTGRALELAALLDMRLEDVQWGHEVTPDALPRLREHWRSSGPGSPASTPVDRPWWRFW